MSSISYPQPRHIEMNEFCLAATSDKQPVFVFAYLFTEQVPIRLQGTFDCIVATLSLL